MKQFFKKVFTTMIGVWLASLVMIFALPVILLLMARSLQGGSETIEKHTVLHLRLRGEIVEHARPLDFDFLSGSSPFSEDEKPTPLYETIEGLKAAAKDPRVDGLYLDLNPFEAGWASLTALHRAIRTFAESGKFVYAHADAFDEKTYYLATSADQIFLTPSGELEYNGLAISEPFLKGLLDKLEVEPRVFRVGKFKAAVEPLILNKMSDANRLQEQTLLDDIWDEARKETARFSGVGMEQLNSFADNLDIATADDAKAKGLVSELSYEDDVLDLMKKKSVGEDKDLNLVSPYHFWRDYQEMHKSKGKDKIALIFADGEIKSGVGGRDSIGAESIVDDIDEASEDENVKAIVLRINSPGGDALAADVIWREIAKVDDTTPVIISMGDVAASGGYYMAAGGRYVLAEPTTITGSIGVFGVMPYTEKLFKNKLSVNFESVSTNKHSNMSDMNHAMDQSEKDFIQKGVDRVYSRFTNVVKEGRDFADINDVYEIAEGRVWSGTRAKEIGLVDEIGGLDLAIEKAKLIAELKKPVSFDIYPKDEDPIMRVLGNFLDTSIRSSLAQSSVFRSLEALAPVLKPLGQVAPLMSAGSGVMKPGVYARLPYDIDIH